MKYQLKERFTGFKLFCSTKTIENPFYNSHSSSMFVVCRADWPQDNIIIQNKFTQMERKSKTSFGYQSEQST